MKVRFCNIRWDTDGEEVDLPTDVVLDVDDDVDLETEGADVLSDEYGWCVFGYDYERVSS